MSKTNHSKEEKAEILNKILGDTDVLKVSSVDAINHKPHPYTIGPRHVSYAADNFGGMLSKECVIQGERERKCKCAHSNCNLPYEDHTFDTVAAVTLLRNCTKEEAEPLFKAMVDNMPKGLVDGFIFIETPEKFRIN